MPEESAAQQKNRRDLLSKIVIIPAAALFGLAVGEGLNTANLLGTRLTGNGQSPNHAYWVGQSGASSKLASSVLYEVASGPNTDEPGVALPNKAWLYWTGNSAEGADLPGAVGCAGIQLDQGGDLNICGRLGGVISILDGYGGFVIAQFARNGTVKTGSNAAFALMNGTAIQWTDHSGKIGYGQGSMGITFDDTDTLVVNTKEGHSMKINDGQDGTNIGQFVSPKQLAGYAFQIQGNGLASGGAWYGSSDRKLKDNIVEIDHALDKVLRLTGVYFTWKDTKTRGGGRQVGFVAQEIQSILPEVVLETQEGELALEYGRMVPLLLEAIKELSARVQALESKH